MENTMAGPYTVINPPPVSFRPFAERLIEKFIEMRGYQKAYFKTRDNAHLMAAKRVETEVDGLLLQYRAVLLAETRPIEGSGQATKIPSSEPVHAETINPNKSPL